MPHHTEQFTVWKCIKMFLIGMLIVIAPFDFDPKCTQTIKQSADNPDYPLKLRKD